MSDSASASTLVDDDVRYKSRSTLICKSLISLLGARYDDL